MEMKGMSELIEERPHFLILFRKDGEDFLFCQRQFVPFRGAKTKVGKDGGDAWKSEPSQAPGRILNAYLFGR